MPDTTDERLGTVSHRTGWILTVAVLLLVLGVLFYRSFLPGQIVFSNDGPLGALTAENGQLPGIFAGFWVDLNWVGMDAPSASPTATSFLRWGLGNVGLSKFYVPISLLALGLAAAYFSRRLGGASLPVMALVGIAAVLNGNYFSNACWGLASRPLALAAVFLALSVFTGPATTPRRTWIKVLLAGAALGVNIMEGYDVGAILSLYVAAYIVWSAWVSEGSVAAALRKGSLRVIVVAVVAAWVSAHTLSTLVGTQVVGRAGMEQTPEAREERWDWATQWSLPKLEALRVIIPGLFGYRMDTPDGGQYWGRVGQQPGWDEHHQGMARHSGAGEYGGVLVALIAALGIAQAARARGGPFAPAERRLVLFWTVAAGISLLLAFGRHAPFYQLIYGLPLFSTMRAPIKFMFPFHLSLLVLFAYGLIGLSRAYLQRAPAVATGSAWAALKRWWGGPRSWEHGWAKWTMGLAAFTVVALFIVVASRSNLERHLTGAGFSPEQATATSGFVTVELLSFLLCLAVAAGILALVVSGALRGGRVRWAWLALGVLLTVDLSRANLPWIVYVDYPHKYMSNPIVDILRQRPYEHRVQVVPFGGGPELEQLQQLYGLEWLQHLFLYYNVQSLDRIMEPRVAADSEAYRAAFTSPDQARTVELMVRKWELTNTRYLLGLGGGFADMLNQRLDPARQRFRLHTSFALVPKREPAVRFEDVTAQLQAGGPFGLIEFTGALPRYALYADWQSVTNASETLQRLTDPQFDPHRTVLVEGLTASPTSSPGADPGTVEITSYHPRRLTFQTRTSQPAVLLLNDKYHPDWQVTVDGAPAELLGGNYLMRAVHLPPGEHQVEFAYRPPTGALYVSLAAIAFALGLCGYLVANMRTGKSDTAVPLNQR